MTDIFGVNDAFKKLQKSFETTDFEVMSVDPYLGEEHNFTAEEQAYPAFLSHCGHDEYFARVLSATKQYQPDMVIGFSSGASAAWKLASEENLSCQHIIGFYPSLIVQPTQTTDVTETTIIFPSQEKIFDVSDAASRLKGTEGLTLELFDGAHGFMNPVCNGFDQQLHQQGLALIRQRFEQVAIHSL